MPFITGDRLGPYEVRSLLGTGGMGEVYLAWDPRLRRDVAIKVLPAAAALDQDRLRRFEQEARAAGALNHPNVLAVHDLGSHDGVPYIVTERLEGETLRDRLNAGGLPVRKSVECAVQIARGLAAAHQRNIIHRDLKPENVFLCRDGIVKILDFGIAKLLTDDAARSEDRTVSQMTRPGTIVGTAAYLSPEQVRGLTVDARSDIFALGLVLYEMLAGRRPFDGETVADLQTAVLREEPRPLSALDRRVPDAIDRVVRRCLEKRPEDRFDTAHDVSLAFEAISAGNAEYARQTEPAIRGRGLRTLAIVAAALVVGVALGPLLFGLLRSSAPPPTYTQLTFRRGTIGNARFAPDGQTIVYTAAWDGQPLRVFTTRIGGRESRDVGIQGDLLNVSSTGDMALVLGAFLARGTLKGTLAQASLSGGAPRELVDDVSAADWDPEGHELAIVRRLGEGAVVEYPIGTAVYRLGDAAHALRVLPDGRLAIFERLADGGDRPFAVSLVDRHGARTVLSRGWAEPHALAWSASTHEIFFGGTTGGEIALHAVSLSGRTRLVMQVPGNFELQDIDTHGRILLSRSFPRGGVLVLPPGEAQERDLSWLDFSSAVDLTPDGRLLLLNELYGGIVLRRTDGTPAVMLGDGVALGLSSDGRFVLALPHETAAADRVVIIPVGAGERRELRHASIPYIFDGAWFPDGQRIVVVAGEDEKRARLYVWRADNASPPQPISPTEVVGVPVVAPDGRWVAVARNHVPLSIYPVGGGPPRLLSGGLADDRPLRWTVDGQSVFVRRGSAIPARIERLEVASGRRSVWREIRPADLTGVFGISSVVMTPDGRSYGYTVASSVGNLYLADGVK